MESTGYVSTLSWHYFIYNHLLTTHIFRHSFVITQFPPFSMMVSCYPSKKHVQLSDFRQQNSKSHPTKSVSFSISHRCRRYRKQRDDDRAGLLWNQVGKAVPRIVQRLTHIRQDHYSTGPRGCPRSLPEDFASRTD